MPKQRHVRLFRNGRNQAVRIPVEFELPGDEAIMHRDGDRLVIEPVRKRAFAYSMVLIARRANHFVFSEMPYPVPFAKIFPFSADPNQMHIHRCPASTRGAYRDRHGRWARDAMDAAAFCARGDRRAGDEPVSDHKAR